MVERGPKFYSYPDRLLIALGTRWEDVDRCTYHPPYFVSDIVLQNPVWADPENISLVKRDICRSYEGIIKTDNIGRPLNPHGPTGIEGRGVLGGWGANFAADPIVTRVNNQGFLELIVIKRKDCDKWALPGGMVDKDERITTTLSRELGEEATADLSFEEATLVYQGYVDDPRNTDNAWMETDAYHLHLSFKEAKKIKLQANDDAADAKWMVCNLEGINNLYASHGFFVKKAISLFEKSQNLKINENGRIID